MAQKTDFTEQEWEQLRKGATGAGMLVAVSDRSFLDSFKEAGSLAKHIAGGRRHENELVKALSSERGTGFELTARPDEVESQTLEALRSSVATLEQKAPEDVEAYRSFVLEVAEAVGKAAGGGDEVEAVTLDKVRSALA